MRRRRRSPMLFPYTTLFRSNVRAVFASGGRLSWRYSDVLEVGTSVAMANDRGGEASRRDAGVDFRILDRKSTRLNSSHMSISYAVFCLKKKSPRSRHGASNQ